MKTVKWSVEERERDAGDDTKGPLEYLDDTWDTAVIGYLG